MAGLGRNCFSSRLPDCQTSGFHLEVRPSLLVLPRQQASALKNGWSNLYERSVEDMNEDVVYSQLIDAVFTQNGGYCRLTKSKHQIRENVKAILVKHNVRHASSAGPAVSSTASLAETASRFSRAIWDRRQYPRTARRDHPQIRSRRGLRSSSSIGHSFVQRQQNDRA
eukprot:TRINITY_DN11797_c0_g1_i1.p4 TRINITY_DN11797_c0_g1~~TRINITY_DN11797_c0_g1_i1.p4  ORF type:complete len:168 (-),score=5.49 TRINITY_DN11797_c0_g1_i1:4233-4736(-)